MDLDTSDRKVRAFEAYTLKGVFNLLRGDPQEAEKDLKKALSFSKKNSSTLARLAACKMEQSNVSEALQLFEKALEADVTNPLCYTQRGQVWVVKRSVFEIPLLMHPLSRPTC